MGAWARGAWYAEPMSERGSKSVRRGGSRPGLSEPGAMAEAFPRIVGGACQDAMGSGMRCSSRTGCTIW